MSEQLPPQLGTDQHYVVRTYIGVRHYNNDTRPFGRDLQAAREFARACGGRPRSPGVVGELAVCTCPNIMGTCPHGRTNEARRQTPCPPGHPDCTVKDEYL